jgi:sn-glycerol 3-phosphate transport system substrate-binding protein
VAAAEGGVNQAGKRASKEVEVRKPILSLLAILLLSVTLGACGGGEESTPTAKTPGASPAAGPVTIDFWHSETAANQDALNHLAERFNASQNEVRVRMSYQGTYDDAMAKLIASLSTGNVPAIMFPAGTYIQTIIDSGAVAPIQDFVDQEDYDLSDLDEKGIEYYTFQGKLWAMPFTMELPLVFYNKVTFREVGLDPEKPPQDLEEVRQYSEKFLKRDGAGNVVRSGLAIDIKEWTQRVLAEHGDLWVDNENGREGRATEVLFDNDTGRWFFRWWHDMVDSGLAFNVGRNPTSAEGLLAIVSGRAPMTFANTGALRSVIDVLATGVEGVEIGVSRLPGAPGSPDQTTCITSYGLFILNLRPKEEQEAAWKFIKWLMEPEQQAEWFAGSGYLPVSRSSVDLPAAQDIVAQYPLFQVALDLYLNAPATSASLMAALGPHQKVNEAVYTGVEEMLSGAKDPEQALEDAAATANEAIAEYNERVEE